jgi:hypothetical protein
MERESGAKIDSRSVTRFAAAQGWADITALILWLAASILACAHVSGLGRTVVEIASIALLGTSVFNIITMIGFAALKLSSFSISRFVIRIAFAPLALIGLALSVFATGIRLQ